MNITNLSRLFPSCSTNTGNQHSGSESASDALNFQGRTARLSPPPNITPEQLAALQARFSEILNISRQDHPDADGTILSIISNSSQGLPELITQFSAIQTGSQPIIKSDGTVLEVRQVSLEQQAADNAAAAKISGQTSRIAPPNHQLYELVD